MLRCTTGVGNVLVYVNALNRRWLLAGRKTRIATAPSILEPDHASHDADDRQSLHAFQNRHEPAAYTATAPAVLLAGHTDLALRSTVALPIARCSVLSSKRWRAWATSNSHAQLRIKSSFLGDEDHCARVFHNLRCRAWATIPWVYAERLHAALGG